MAEWRATTQHGEHRLGRRDAAQVTGRKLIEVALPLEAINKESAREKSIRHGHPATLHLWWARRPLAAARAVLFAQLVDDPASRPEAAEIADTEEREEWIRAERTRLFRLIEDLVQWENTGNERLLKEAHAEILRSTDGNPPPILDPFAGGGTIPLEAQRLGLQAHASDLNPVAVLINKALIEIPPKFAGRSPVFPGAAESRLGDWPKAAGLAEDVRRYGQWMRDEAEKRIGHLYPKAKLEDGSEAAVIAWIWARTVTCPNPACGIEMPLVRSWWLGKKKGKEAYVVPEVIDGPDGKQVEYGIGHDPNQAPTKDTDGTVGRTGAVCVACDTAVPLKYIREEGKSRGLGANLMAIVAKGERKRVYLPPTEEQAHAAQVPRPTSAPDAPLPVNPRDFKTPNYGLKTFASLFTNRQLTVLTTFSDLVSEAREKVLADALVAAMPEGERLADGGTDAAAYADAVATYLGFSVSKFLARNNTMCSWESGMDRLRGSFQRQAIP
jgi:putative DNA methylase